MYLRPNFKLVQVKNIIDVLETLAPTGFQESYDNAGLIVGNREIECTGVMISLDVTEAVLQEAKDKGCNIVVAHHPLIFRGIKRITGKNYVERALIFAIRNDIAIYAINTNLDNVSNGVNVRIAEKIGLVKTSVLMPKDSLLQKLVTFVPVEQAEKVRSAIFSSGGGDLGKYSECSFNIPGEGTFKAGEGADPFIGEVNKRHTENEMRIEVIFPSYRQQAIVDAMKAAHPYEEVAYDILQLGNFLSDVGSGMSGELETEFSETEFLSHLKNVFGLKIIRHTAFSGRLIRKVAVCGGAGIFLLEHALRSGADAFITSDIKYHEFFDADGKILLADIGHYESEQFTSDLLHDVLVHNFPNFAILKTGVNTNPVGYF